MFISHMDGPNLLLYYYYYEYTVENIFASNVKEVHKHLSYVIMRGCLIKLIFMNLHFLIQEMWSQTN